MSKSSVTTTTSVTTVSVDRDEQGGPRPPIRVLIVDDNKDTCDSLIQVGMMMGVDAEGAYSESEAMALMSGRPFPYEAVVFDVWIQPGAVGGGIRLLNWIRSDEGPGAKIPCVLMTGVSPTELDKGEDVIPFEDPYLIVVHKPIEPMTVFNVLAGVVENNRNKEKSDAATSG